MDEKLKRKYIAVKPKGFKYYIWFKTDKISEYVGTFIGKDGWGKNGALTSIECHPSQIESTIYSDELQYS